MDARVRLLIKYIDAKINWQSEFVCEPHELAREKRREELLRRLKVKYGPRKALCCGGHCRGGMSHIGSDGVGYVGYPEWSK